MEKEKDNMNLIEQLEFDLKEAMRAKDKNTLAVLRMVKGAMQLEKINHNKEMNDELAIDIISKQIKTRNESIKEFAKGNRQDLIDQTNKEIDILNKYLPVQLTEDEIQAIITDVFTKINPQGQSDMGKIMKEITPLVKGKADMGKVSQLIKAKLQ